MDLGGRVWVLGIGLVILGEGLWGPERLGLQVLGFRGR